MTYSVPTMTEIRGVAWNGLVAASLFAGAGGSSLGYRMAGFRMAYANEFDEHAAHTYSLNKADYTVVDTSDICSVEGQTILEACSALGRPELDVLDGSPPCQDFSMAGRRAMDGERAQLFYEYVRLARTVQPRVFVAENVEGLAHGQALGHLIRILNELQDAGYRVRRHVLDSSRLGVPQTRKRLIIIGTRSDLDIDPREAFPLPSARQKTVNDALPHVGHFAPARTVTTGGLATSPPIRENGSVSHRGYNVEELKALCSFPADFQMDGSIAQQKKRLGNAVPPLMARGWAERIGVLLTRPGLTTTPD